MTETSTEKIKKMAEAICEMAEVKTNQIEVVATSMMTAYALGAQSEKKE